MDIGKFLDTVHFIAIFSPILLYAIPPVYLKPLNPYMKWILLWFILIPLHWPFFNNQCIFTIITRKISKKKGTQIQKLVQRFQKETSNGYINQLWM